MTVPMGSLRVSVQQRLGVQRSRSGHRSSNPPAIWISPVVIRERVRSLNMLDTSDMAKNNMASLVTQELKTISGPYHMAFVSSNCLALRILGEFLPVQVSGNEKWRIPAQTSPLPHGTATRCPKDAIIIHHRRIFLSLKKPDRITGPRGNFVTPALPFKPKRKLVLESPAVSSKQMVKLKCSNPCLSFHRIYLENSTCVHDMVNLHSIYLIKTTPNVQLSTLWRCKVSNAVSEKAVCCLSCFLVASIILCLLTLLVIIPGERGHFFRGLV